MVSEPTFEDLIRELSGILDDLNALPTDAFAERSALHTRQDELREEIGRFRRDLDADRATGDLLAELESQRARLAALEGQRIDLVAQSGGGTSAGPGADGGGAVVLNQQIGAAAGVGEVQARIGRIKGILIDRGVDVPPAE